MDEKIRFSNVTTGAWEKLRHDFAVSDGAQLSGSGPSAFDGVSHGVHFHAEYDSTSAEVLVTVTGKPFFVPTSLIHRTIAELIEKDDPEARADSD